MQAGEVGSIIFISRDFTVKLVYCLIWPWQCDIHASNMSLQ